MTEASENIWMIKNSGVEIDVDVSVLGGDRAEVFDELEWVVGVDDSQSASSITGVSPRETPENVEDALEGRDGEVVRHE